MTDTLKKLASLFPEKFEYSDLFDDGELALREPWMLANSDSQDGIDSILAEIGKRMLLRLISVGGLPLLMVDIYDLNWKFLYTTSTGETDKLLAAQAAVRAVVEQLEKEGGKK